MNTQNSPVCQLQPVKSEHCDITLVTHDSL